MSSAEASTKTNIMSNEQVGNVQRGALAWLTPKTHEKSLQFLQAVKFELVTDKECWLRGSGKITVRMLIEFDQQSHNGTDKEIKVNSPDNAFYDLKGIAVQLASILSEYLQAKNHVALIHFTGETKEAMMKAWQPQAKKWLADDIGADPNVFEYLHFQTEAGRKLTIKIPLMSKAIELEMQFKQGLCYFDVLASKFETELSALFNKFDDVVVFDHAQLASLKRTIAPLLIEAIRDQKFSHPYPNHAIKSVLGIRKDITSYAEELGIAPLALAGVMADEYEDDLAPKVKQVFADLEEILLLAVARNYNSIDDTISFGLSLISKIVKKGSLYLTLADVLWSVLPDFARKALVDFAVKAIERSLTDLPEAVLISLTETHDQISELSLKAQIKLEAAQKALKRDIAQCGKEMKEYVIKNKDLVDLFNLTSGIWYGGGQESITSRAAKIQAHLDHANLPPDQREYICKWERLYPYFKA